ncbi:MAG TPA: class I SAM-dependent methyltransferase [Polyangium sp.]|nr:class I SAM-dependent methyltransferase [Polyangium sp.]
MNRLPTEILEEMSRLVTTEDRNEMAIPSYLHRNPLMREMAWARVHALETFLRRVASRRRLTRIVDYGCGTGVLLPAASDLAESVYGVDLVTEPAQWLVGKLSLPNVQIMKPEECATIASGSVDVILAGEVLEHIDPVEPALVEYRRLLHRKGARLLVSLPTENALYRFGRRLAGFSGHYHHDNARSIDAKIRRGGFERVDRTWIPLPGPLSVYWVMEYAPSPA